MYCHPLLTRTRRASSSITYAIVPTGLADDIFVIPSLSWKVTAPGTILFCIGTCSVVNTGGLAVDLPK